MAICQTGKGFQPTEVAPQGATSVYLALAVTQECQMVTADERFFNALQSDSLAVHLCWVEDLP